MAQTIDINEAAKVVQEAEHAALKSTKALTDRFLADLAEVEATLPERLSMDASKIINEIRGNLSYVRSTTLPQALYRFEPDSVPVMTPAPLYVAPSPPAPEGNGNAE